MYRDLFKKGSAVLVGLLLTGVVSAATVNYALDVTFVNGNTASGTFSYDANTSTVSNVDILLDGSYFWGWDPQLDEGVGTAFHNYIAFHNSSQYDLYIQFDTPLLPHIDPTTIGIIGDAQTDYDRLDIATASLTHAVPVPAAAWLFGSALAGLGWMRRKQTI